VKGPAHDNLMVSPST